MATFNSSIFGELTGSIGNVTACKYRDKNVVKSKIRVKSKKTTLPQQAQRTRMKVLSELAHELHLAIREGHPGQSWSAARTAFIGANQAAVEIDAETLAVTMHHDLITCSGGNLTPPSVHVTLRDSERVVHAEWFRQPLSPVAKDEDDLYLALHDTTKGKSRVYPLGKRGVPATTEFPLHKDFSPTTTLAYTFALSAQRNRASVSAYTEVVHE